MKLILGIGLLAATLPLCQSADAQLRYVDAADDVGGNTTLASGAVLAASDTTGSSNWRQRNNADFGSHSNVFEGIEPSPLIKTTISGLTPGVAYEIFVHFWDPQSTAEDWNVRAGFSTGSLKTFAREAGAVTGATASVLASSLPYASPPTLFGPVSFRDNLAGLVGIATATSSGEIVVFIDDFGSTNVNLRTWYDGLSYITYDGDLDGMRDLWEIANGLDPSINDALLDADSDGLSNVEEFDLKMDPQNPDMDGDGFLDGYEVNVGTDPRDALEFPADLDGDGMDDNWELRYGLDPSADDSFLDLDGDGLTNIQEFLGADGVIGGLDQTKPDNPDSDEDSFGDFVEVTLGSIANDPRSTPSGLIAHSDFNVMPWSNQGLGAARAESHPILPHSKQYGVIDTTLRDSGAILTFANPDSLVSCMLDFRVVGTLDARINITTANVHRVQTGPEMHCMLLIMPDGSIDYFSGGTWLHGPGAGTIVPEHTYSVRLLYDIPAARYSIMLLDRTNGDLAIPVAGGLPIPTRNTSPGQTLHFSIGVEADSPTGFELSVDNMVVARGDKPVGSSQSLFDSDLDGASDIWEFEKLRTLDLLGRPEDPDGDLMDQAWEIAMFGDESAGALDNPDGDLAPNWEEYFYGSDPNTFDSNTGYWTLERWYDMPYYSVAELTGDQRFYGPPTTTTTLTRPGIALGVPYAGSRMRGYVQVEETGEYRFWLSCRTSGELMLSTDETPYRKRRIAYLGPDAGTGHGVRLDSPNLWDVFASQMSAPVTLEAGRKYYLEVNHQNGHGAEAHVNLAWAKNNGARMPIPRESMSSFVPLPEDADDDSLPDDWEIAHGLDPSDNGFGDIQKQGERGDLDGDGLSNREEFLAGTDPSNSDTDGDGLSDSDELHGNSTNPLVSDAPAEGIVSTLDLNTFLTADHPWTMVDGGLLSDTFRGKIEWNLDIPSSGTWIIQVDSQIRGTVYVNELVHVNVRIDGEFIGRYPLRYGGSHKGIMRVISPQLAAGTHVLSLEIDNLLGRRMVQIDAITLRQPSGPDSDADGIPDWIETKLAEDDFVKPHATTSRTSPFCLEGRARIPTSLLLNAGNVHVGGDAGHWYANLSMLNGYDTNYTVSFANGQQVQGEVYWWATNVLDEEVLTIREGDSLRLGAWVGNGGSANTEHPNKKDSQGNGVVSTITVDGTGHNLGNSRDTHVHTFTTAGTYQVHATHVSGASGTLTVIVRHAGMPDDTTVVQNTVRYWTLADAQADRSLFFEAGEGLGLGPLQGIDAESYRFRLYPSEGGLFGVVARLWDGGPILDVANITSVTVTDALQNGLSTVFNSEFAGFYSLTTPMVALDLPPGGKVVVTIFRAGVTFMDGTKVKEYFADDFVDGVTYLEFLLPIGEDGGYCHYIDIYDAEGNHLGSR